MGIFAGILEEQRAAMVEARSSLNNPQTPLSFPAEWLLDLWNGGRTDSGVRVSELTAFQCVTFLSGVDLISGTIASLPCHIYERSLNAHGRAIDRIAFEHDYYEFVNLEPNDEMSQQTFTKALLCHCLAWGNGYAEIQRDGGNAPLGLWPRNPYKTKPFRVMQTTRLAPVAWRPFPVILPAGTLCYKTTDHVDDLQANDEEINGYERIIAKEDMLHVPGLSLDGRIGQSAVYLARNVLGLALAAEKFGGKYFANFAKPGGILELPVMSNPADREKTRNSWMEAQGGENAHRVAVVPPGTKFTAISNNPEQSQSIETQQFVRQQIASLLHVPPHMLGDVDKGRANTEQMAQELIQYTFTPWLNALKQEYKRKLFPMVGGRRTQFYIGFDMSALIRPDAASREKYNASGRQWGYLNANDVRANEGLNPINEDWAEQYWMPVNMTLSTTPINPTHQDGGGNGDVPEKEPVAA